MSLGGGLSGEDGCCALSVIESSLADEVIESSSPVSALGEKCTQNLVFFIVWDISGVP